MIRLSDLRTPGVALEWHEAVAVAAAFTSAVGEARLAHAPTLEGALLTPDGEVALSSGAPRAPGSITQGLAVGLAGLLETTPCPAELRQLVTKASTAALDVETVADFSRALTFFERPSRPDVLRDLAARAAVAVDRARAADALERLTERARRADEVVVPPIAVPRASLASSVRRLAAPIAVAMFVFAAVALVAATLFTASSAPSASAALEVGPIDDDEVPSVAAASPSPRLAAAAADARRSGTEDDATGSAGRGDPPLPAARPSASALARGTALATVAATADAEVVVTVTELGGAVLPADAKLPVIAGPAARAAASRVFSPADRDVAPAIMIKPQLPAEPPAEVPPWEVGTLELTVSTTGTVEQVRLISPYNRYQERMLVAAAKAWLFQPASRDGQPVRFRTRIRVTL